MSRPVEPATIKVRAPLWLRISPLMLGVAMTALWFIAFRRVPPFFVLYWLGFGAGYFVAQSWFGVDLTPTGAVVNSVQRRRIPWWAVQAVTQEPFLGGRRVILWTVRGERVPLRAPITDFTGLGSQAFDRSFHQIGQWWLTHRPGPGPDGWGTTGHGPVA